MSKKTNTWRVWATCTTYLYIDVEAGDYARAIEMGQEADGGDFVECPDAEWEITDANELEHG